MSESSRPGLGSAWLTFWTASGAIFLVSLDTTSAVVTFPALRADFPGTSPALLSWVINASAILYAALLVPAGRLADLVGRKRIFVIGLSVFTGASILCGAAPDVGWLIAARAVQAVGGALLTPCALALVLGAFPTERRAAVMGLWSAVGALAATIGPTAGSALVDAFSWRAVFFANVPIGLVVLAAAFRNLSESRSPQTGGGLDLPGVTLLALATALLALGVVQSEEWGLVHAGVWGSIAVGLALFGVYGLWARGRPDAALDLSLFDERNYVLATWATFLFGIAFSIMFLASYLFMIEIWRFSPTHAGMALIPGPLMVMPSAILAGRLAGRIGHRPLILAGALLFAAAQLTLMVRVTTEPAYWSVWFPAQLATGISIGMLISCLAGAAVAQLPPERFGVGGAVNNAVRQLGGVIGSAIAVVLVGAAAPGLIRFETCFLVVSVLALASAVVAQGMRRGIPPATPLPTA